MKEAIFTKLKGIKWNLIVMAVLCFFLSVYIYVTPEWGGPGVFMITPRNGLTGLLQMLPWIGIFLGAVSFILSFASTSAWVLGWIEPAMGVVMFVAGFWELFFPYDIRVFSQTYAVVGIFLAFYVMFTALDMQRKAAGHWVVQLVLAAAIWCVSFFNLMNFAGLDGQVAVTCLELFLAGWGFVYASLVLSGIPPQEGKKGCPFCV